MTFFTCVFHRDVTFKQILLDLWRAGVDGQEVGSFLSLLGTQKHNKEEKMLSDCMQIYTVYVLILIIPRNLTQDLPVESQYSGRTLLP